MSAARRPRPAGRALRRLLAFLLSALAARGLPCLPAAAADPPDEARVRAAYVYNIENGLPLFERDSETPLPPASTVKIMTGLLACRALSARTDESVVVTQAMLAGAEGRRMGLEAGETLTVLDLLYAAFCGGYNDAALVLAALAEGDVAAFVGAMNREAERLRLTNTRYANPTGLDDPSMVTCARDVAAVAREAYRDPLYMTVSSARSHAVPATNRHGERFFLNRNELISGDRCRDGSCRGLNAGMTDAGGYCVVTVSERGGAANLCVVMGGGEAEDGGIGPAYAYAGRLLEWASKAYAYRTVRSAGEVWDTLPVGMTGLSRSRADVTLRDDLRAYLPAGPDAGADLTLRATLDGGRLTAPLSEGETVGSLAALDGDRVAGRVDLIVTEDFKRNAFLARLAAFRRYLTSRAFLASAACFLLLYLLYRRRVTGPGGRYGIRSVRRGRRKVRPNRQNKRRNGAG